MGESTKELLKDGSLLHKKRLEVAALETLIAGKEASKQLKEEAIVSLYQQAEIDLIVTKISEAVVEQRDNMYRVSTGKIGN